MRFHSIVFKISFITLPAISPHASGFGVSGTDGRNGASGFSGGSGDDITVFADGSVRSIYAEGGPGSDGGNGGSGGDARSCYFGRPNHDTFGARGGDGGDGGRGGRGGRGGDVTIFTSDIGFLDKMTVVAAGGEGGRSGYPGRAGRGCYCNPQTWTTQHCRMVSDGSGGTRRECRDERHYCHKGSSGRRGSYGRSGFSGQSGSIKVYLSQVQPDPAVGSIAVELSEISSAPYELSYDVWESRNNARSILASGSQVRSRYKIWLGQEFKSIGVEWLAAADPQDFVGEFLTLKYSHEGFEYRYPRGAWLKISFDPETAIISITDAMKWSVVQKATWVSPGKENIWLLHGTKNMRKTPEDSGFKVMPGSGSRLAVGLSDEVYGIDNFSKLIYRFEDGSWQRYTGDRAKRLALGPTGLFTIDLFQNIWQRDHEKQKWRSLKTKSSEISVGPSGDLWSIYLNGEVYEYSEEKWVKRGIKATRISVGPSGPWVVNKHGKVFKYLDENHWQEVDAGIKEIAVSSNNEVYGVTPGHFLMKFQGAYFRPVLK